MSRRDPNEYFSSRESIDEEFIEYITSLVNRYTNREMLNIDSESNIFFNFNISSSISKYSQDEYDLTIVYYNHIRDEWLTDNNERINLIPDLKNYIEKPSLKILNIILKYFSENDEMFPTIDVFLDLVYNNRCLCIDRFSYLFQTQTNQDIIKKIIQDFVMIYSFYPSCNYFSYYIEFFILHNRIPSEEELTSFMERAREFFISPEDFHQKDKLLVPTLNINKLPIEQFNNISNPINDCCAICREEFSPATQTVKLSPCNHLFHSNDSECLQDASIFNWLHCYNFCPLCKTKIDCDS